jgi:hypothetical protein
MPLTQSHSERMPDDSSGEQSEPIDAPAELRRRERRCSAVGARVRDVWAAPSGAPVIAVSVVIPVLNEVGNVRPLIDELACASSLPFTGSGLTGLLR